MVITWEWCRDKKIGMEEQMKNVKECKRTFFGKKFAAKKW
jgi:hypothetical protein